MHGCPKTHFKHKCMHSSYHATSPCHIIIPCHHATSACHVIIPHHHAMSACHIIMQYQHAMSSCQITMPCHHATSSCHVIRMHFLTTTCSLRECHVALQPKFTLLGPNFKTQYLLHPKSVWHAVCTAGVGLTSSSTWYYFCCNMMILKIGLFRSFRIKTTPKFRDIRGDVGTPLKL